MDRNKIPPPIFRFSSGSQALDRLSPEWQRIVKQAAAAFSKAIGHKKTSTELPSRDKSS